MVQMKWLASIALCLASAYAQHEALDTIAKEEIEKQKIPGLVLVVVKGDAIAYAKGFGVANVETKEPLTPDHLFRVGSTTKMITGAAAAALAHQGKLKMDAPIGGYLHELSTSPLGKLTAHQLLTHTAGLMDRTLMFGRHDDEALADNVRSLQPDVLFTKPGEIYSYSNLGFAIAGRLIEVISGKPFADAVDSLVFKPLAMRRTTFRPTMAMTYPLAQGHIKQNTESIISRPAADHSGYWPAGSMFTSGNDFARFAMALLGKGNGTLPPAVLEMITQPHVRSSASTGSYGYGIGVASINGKRVFSHGGARQGYSTYLIASPEAQTAAIALIHESGANPSRPAERAFEAIAGWSPREPAAGTRENSLKPEQIAGTYTQYTRTVVIKLREGKLYVTEQGKDIELKATGGDCYQTQNRVCFLPGQDGRARYLMVGSRAMLRAD